MDLQGFSVEISEAVKEAITLAQHRNGRTYKYELVALFARIWFLKAQILGSTVTEEFMNGLRDGSRFLLTSFTPKFKEMSNLVEQVPLQVESQNGKKSMVRDYLHKFLAQAMLFKAEVLLSELWLKHETLRDTIGTLQEGIIFLIKWDINLLRKKEDSDDEKLVLADFEQLAAGVISVCRSKAGIESMESQLSGLLEEVESLKSKLRKLYFQRPKSGFPKTPGVVPVELLLERLKGMRIQKHGSLACAAYQIEVICKDLELCLKHSDDVTRAQLVEAAYQVEYVIDSMGGTKYSESLLLMWLYDQSQDIKGILTAPGSKSNTSTAYHSLDIEMPMSQPSILWSDATMGFSEETALMVGFEDEKAALIDRLTRGSRRREIVSITGMASAGKSTLARHVFRSPAITNHFHARAWCTVSQVYTVEKLLLEILSQITVVTNDMLAEKMTDDLMDMVYTCLRGKRYLIVMDDVWSSEVFSKIGIEFPDDKCQSKILMTSRNAKVVQNPYPLRGLTEEESCELLQVRIFGDKGWPSECLEVVKQIAQLCKGLPLAIVAVAGILKNVPKDAWPGVVKEMYSMIATDPMIMKIIDLSYLDLPDHLKECFLYFGVFPKDKDILVRKLLWLWIAEGFVRKVDSRSLEDLAEEYLMILIDRHLVSVTKLGSNGNVKKCRVEGVLLEICLLKAKDANFSQLISSKLSDFKNSAQHRLTIFGDPENFIASKPSGTYVRSLLHFATDEIYPGCHTDMRFVSENFELLKVMSLESVNVGYTLENDIGLPVYLRYLAVGGDMNSLPSSLPKLQYLQTLIVKGLMNKFAIPSTIWSMKSLRHIDVSNHCLFTLQSDGDGTLDSLVSLSMPSFSYVKETDYILRRFPNLRKLKCILLEPCVGSMQISQFPTFEYLYNLESLKLTHHGWPLDTRGWNFVYWALPCALKELSLSSFGLPWDWIRTISRLRNLKVLKLMSKAFEGTTWEMEEGGFENLRYLKLDSLNIVEWNAAEEHLPYLEHLVLRNCKQLKEVPSAFGEIDTLQRIQVHECGVSVEKSVRIIAEQQLEYGNVNFRSNVSPFHVSSSF